MYLIQTTITASTQPRMTSKEYMAAARLDPVGFAQGKYDMDPVTVTLTTIKRPGTEHKVAGEVPEWLRTLLCPNSRADVFELDIIRGVAANSGYTQIVAYRPTETAVVISREGDYDPAKFDAPWFANMFPVAIGQAEKFDVRCTKADYEV